MSAAIRKIPPPKAGDVARFTAAVANWQGVVGCWEWQRAQNAYGYGAFGIGRQVYSAHRVAKAWFGDQREYHVDDLPLMHTCDNRRCVRPSHLVPGSPADNSRDMARKSRDTGKLTESQRQDVAADTRPQRTIASMYGISPAAVSYIKRRAI